MIKDLTKGMTKEEKEIFHDLGCDSPNATCMHKVRLGVKCDDCISIDKKLKEWERNGRKGPSPLDGDNRGGIIQLIK